MNPTESNPFASPLADSAAAQAPLPSPDWQKLRSAVGGSSLAMYLLASGLVLVGVATLFQVGLQISTMRQLTLAFDYFAMSFAEAGLRGAAMVVSGILLFSWATCKARFRSNPASDSFERMASAQTAFWKISAIMAIPAIAMSAVNNLWLLSVP